jgi:hypothetical protein
MTPAVAVRNPKSLHEITDRLAARKGTVSFGVSSDLDLRVTPHVESELQDSRLSTLIR